MNNAEFQQSIRAGFDIHRRLELTSWDRFPFQKSLEPGDEFRRVALDSSSSYPEIFQAGIRNKTFNWILKDFSFLQFNRSESDSGIRLRYAFYPNPFDGPVEFEEMLESFSDSDPWDLQELAPHYFDDAVIRIGKPTIRYDFSPGSSVHLRHAAAHMHVGFYQECRIPCALILSPFAFAMFVAKHFFSAEWVAVAGIDEDLTDVSEFEALYGASAQGCERVGSDMSVREEFRRLHIGVRS